MNQKELNELGDLINERRELEVKFKVDVAKLDEKIAARIGKLQPDTVMKPVKVEEYTRDKPRKERSDKGKARPNIDPRRLEPLAQPGGDSEGIDPADQKKVDDTLKKTFGEG